MKDKKEVVMGNTKVVIYSNIVNLSSAERRKWFEDEKAKGNPILQEIADAVKIQIQP